MKKLAMILILLLAPATSFADDPFYRSGNLYTVYNLVNFKDFGAGNATGFAFQAGYDITSWLALEGHVGMTNDVKQSVTSGATYTDTKVRASYASLVGRGNLRFGRTTVFAFAGVTYLEVKGSVDYNGTSRGVISDTDTGATYGFGVDLYGSENAAITLKATRVYKPKDNKAKISSNLDSAMLGITYYIH
jgi:hypothetical protein